MAEKDNRKDDVRGFYESLKPYYDKGTSNPDTLSLSDRLRPPYQSPLPWLEPKNIAAASFLERGFDRLPEAYKNLLREIRSDLKIPTGVLPDDLNTKGLWAIEGTSETRNMRAKEGIPPRFLLGDEPKTFSHELIHALREFNPSARRLIPKYIEEILARQVAGNPIDSKRPARDIANAREIDATMSFVGALPGIVRRMFEDGGAFLFKDANKGER